MLSHLNIPDVESQVLQADRPVLGMERRLWLGAEPALQPSHGASSAGSSRL